MPSINRWILDSRALKELFWLSLLCFEHGKPNGCVTPPFLKNGASGGCSWFFAFLLVWQDFMFLAGAGSNLNKRIEAAVIDNYFKLF